MKSVWKFAIFFAVCLLLALLINLPVGYLLPSLKVPDNIRFSHLRGSLFQGQANALSIDRVVLQDLRYEFKIGCLLTASLCYQLEFSDGSALIRYSPISDSIETSRLDVEVSTSLLAGVTQGLLIKPSGNIQVSSDRIKLVAGRLIDIDATLVWKNAGIEGDSINLGDYRLHLIRDAGVFRAEISDDDALLDVEGRGELKSSGSYTLNVNVESRPGLEPRIRNALDLVASKRGLNQYSIRRSGAMNANLFGRLSFDRIE